MICDNCDNVATYLYPRRYCDHHWCEWWAESIGRTTEDQEKIYQEAMDIIDDVVATKQLFMEPTVSQSCIKKLFSELEKSLKTLASSWQK
jgi:hypothetical protein